MQDTKAIYERLKSICNLSNNNNYTQLLQYVESNLYRLTDIEIDAFLNGCILTENIVKEFKPVLLALTINVKAKGYNKLLGDRATIRLSILNQLLKKV